MIGKGKLLLVPAAVGVTALLFWAFFHEVGVEPAAVPIGQEAETVEAEEDPVPVQDEGSAEAADPEEVPGEEDEEESAVADEGAGPAEESDQEERLVDAFDNLTDTWCEPAKRAVKMEEIETFVRRFRAVPKARREECLQRALNLIPDENVMLLAGILMDKTQDRELVELVYNDVLNRDEDVKKPVLLEIFKDREHPCWADTAWILDATGETPEPVEK